jgi:outer membrane protein insertion porin family
MQIKRVFLASILLLMTLPTMAGDAVRLVAIRISGSHEFNETEVARASGLKLNQTIGPAEFKNAADRLAASGAFASVGYKYGPQGSGMFVEFQLEDAPRFLPVRYENFVWMSDKELTEELSKRVPLFHGNLPEGGGVVDQVTEAMTAILAERGVAGHGQMRLHAAGLNKPADAVSLFVDGVNLPVREFELTNASRILVPQLQDALRPLLGSNFERGVTGESITYRLKPFYQDVGMLNVVVDAPTTTLLGDPKAPQIKVTVNVREGLQYNLGQVHWTGISIFSEPELLKPISNPRGKTLKYSQFVNGVKKAADKYANKGYLEAKIGITPTFHDEEQSVDYELQVTEGRQFKMARFTVTGLDPAVCEQLEKTWKLQPGDPYDSSVESHFLNDNVQVLRGRPARITQTPHPDGTVDVKMDF